jgi:hypothetical protein
MDSLHYVLLVISYLVLSITAKTWTYPAWPVLGPVNTEFISHQAVDAPKHSAINSSVWDWWYFDIVSSDLHEAIVITFDLGTATGIIGGGFGTVPYVAAFPSWSDGFNGFNSYPASEAIITTDLQQSSSGFWKGAGLSWNAPSGTSFYELEWDSPDIKGTLKFVSRAPPHYPCGGTMSGSNLEIGKIVMKRLDEYLTNLTAVS